MKTTHCLCGCLAALLLCGSALPAAQGFRKTTLLYENTFSSPDSLKDWRDAQPRHLEANAGKDGKSALHFVCDSHSGADWIHFRLDRARLGEGLIWLEAEVRGQDIREPKVSYLGTKVMLTIDRGGKMSHPEPPHVTGTFDWQTLMTIQHLGKDVDQVTLSLGIQGTPGHFWVNAVRIYRCVPCDGPGDLASLKPTGRRAADDIPRGLGLGARYRGVMSGNDLSEEAFQTLRAWNANLIRYQLLARQRDVSTPDKYLAWIDDEMKTIDEILDRAQRHGFKIVIDLHTGPGTIISDVASNILGSGTRLDVLDETWRRLATRYRNHPAVYGYDLLNEPKVSEYLSGTENPWWTITDRLVKVIRPIDPTTPIITEPNFRNFRPIDDPHIIYSPHYYSPHSYTHQGVGGRKNLWAYPGFIDGQWWDKETIREALRPDITFALTHKVPMFVGEFSAAIWNEGADQYLRDCIEIFEEYGWDWTYHAFREASIWDVEMEVRNGRVVRAKESTPRQDALRAGLAANGRQRVLILGNSITSHGPNASIGWNANWGMAASAPEKDFAHLLLERLRQQAHSAGKPAPVACIRNIATFERQFATLDLRDLAFPFADFRPDLIVLAIGENVPALDTPELQRDFHQALTRLIQQLRHFQPDARLVVRSCFWPNAVKDRLLKQVCDEQRGTFVDISALAKDERCFARSERPFKHNGVANHPGDFGMNAIADAIWNALGN